MASVTFGVALRSCGLLWWHCINSVNIYFKFLQKMSANRRPSIQIALAVYNGEEFLSEFLDSLLVQSYSDFQLLVSDDGSSDTSVSILKSYAHRFVHGIELLSPRASLRSAARNFAYITGCATSDYLMYADQDDIWDPDKIEKTFEAMLNAEERYGRNEPILVHSDLRVVDRHLKQLSGSYWDYQNINPARIELRQILMRNCVVGCTCMLNRALLTHVIPIPPEAPMHDYWCAATAAAVGRIVTLPIPLIGYRQHAANDTGAAKWGLRFLVRRLRSLRARAGIRGPIKGKIKQARALLARHGNVMSDGSRAVLEAMATLDAHNAIVRRWYMVKFGLWDSGIVRNVLLFLTA